MATDNTAATSRRSTGPPTNQEQAQLQRLAATEQLSSKTPACCLQRVLDGQIATLQRQLDSLIKAKTSQPLITQNSYASFNSFSCRLLALGPLTARRCVPTNNTSGVLHQSALVNRVRTLQSRRLDAGQLASARRTHAEQLNASKCCRLSRRAS